jgi:hypothetical protein
MGDRPISSRARPALQSLAELPDEAYAQLAAAVATAEASTDLGQIRTHVLSDMAADYKGVTDTILEALFSTAAHRTHVGLPPADFAESLDTSDLGVPADTAAKLAPRLAELLAAKAIILSMRGLELLGAGQRYVVDCRIITDLRPIFPEAAGPDGQLEPSAAMVTHSLRIEYIENGDEKAFVVALDSEDIATLRKALDRAESKAAALGRLTENAGLDNLTRQEKQGGQS